jgi:hypothetical protein
VRRLLGIIATTVTIVGLGVAPARADSTVTVHGTDFPDARAAQLTLVGCGSLYERSTEFLLPRIARRPDRVGLGTRSLMYDLAGGNAIGTLSYVDSMAHTTVASLQVYSPTGAQGVAYAGFQRPDAGGTYDLWIGRAPVSATGSWQRVDATSLSYTWAEFDMRTGQPTGESAAPATVKAFASANGGDGAGFYMVGFGCDGSPFYMDGWRIGAPGAITTYDLEALTTHLTIGGSATSIEAGDEVRINGSVRDGRDRRLVRGTMILEAKPVGAPGFLPVQVVDAAATDPSVTVAPTESTIYRWRFAERPLATGSVSREFRVDVEQPEPEPSEEPSEEPAEEPAPDPRPSAKPSSEPTASEPAPPATEEPAPPTTEETVAPDPPAEPEVTEEPTDPAAATP